MVYLRVVIVPLVLALFLTLLIEPLFWLILNPPGFIMTCCPRTMRRFRHRLDPIANAASQPSLSTLAISGEWPHGHDEVAIAGCNSGTQLLQTVIKQSWVFFAVLVSMLILMTSTAIVFYIVIQAVRSCPWEKYKASPKLKMVLEYFPHLGTDPLDLKVELIIPWLLQGPLFNALDLTFAIISQIFLTILFLAFFLASDAHLGVAEIDAETIGHKIRKRARSYIRIKTLMAIICSMMIGSLYWLWGVDLYALFTLITFVMYYIPHVGNTIAVLAPLPVVFLDPEQTWTDLAFLFLVPFLLHQICTNLIDPRLLASSLELHPIIVLISLAFWTCVWGPVGAVLSAPITAALRLVLLELDHPYFNPVANILEGNFTSVKERDNSKAGDVRFGSGAEGAPAEVQRGSAASDSDTSSQRVEMPSSEGSLSPRKINGEFCNRREPSVCMEGEEQSSPPRPDKVILQF